MKIPWKFWRHETRIAASILAAAVGWTGCAADRPSPKPAAQRKALVLGRGLPVKDPDGGDTHPQRAKNTFLQLVGNPGNNPNRGWTCDLSWDLLKQLDLDPLKTLPEELFGFIGRKGLGYRIVIQNAPNGANASKLWGTAVDEGMMPFAPQGDNNPGRRFEDGLGLHTAVSVAGGVTRNQSSYGPGVEFIDALDGGDAAQSWANQVVASKFARVLEDHPEYNIWDARQHLRQAASNWEAGWNERDGYGRINLGVRVGRLAPAPPLEFNITATPDRRTIFFTWRNFLQSDFDATVIARGNGKVIYEGRDRRFVWNSDATGPETFTYWSRNKAGETSRIESYQKRSVANLDSGPSRKALVLGAPPTDDDLNLKMCEAFEVLATNWYAETVFRAGNPAYDRLREFPSGKVVAVLPDVGSMVSYAITNGYRLILAPSSRAEGDLYRYKPEWDRAAAAGIVVVLPHHYSLSTSRRPEARRLSPPRISSAIFVGAGTITNRLSFGPGLECYDAPDRPLVLGGGLMSQMDGAVAVAAKLARILDENPGYNSWDARQHLRQTCGNYASVWAEDGGFGRPAQSASRPARLEPAAPVEIQATRSDDGKTVAFSWQNFRQTSYSQTVIQRGNGRQIYSGTGTGFAWKSDVDGSETFRVFARDSSGQLSKPEPFTVLTVTGLSR